MFANFGAGEDSWEYLGQQGDQISQFWRNQPWIYIGRNDAEAEDPILWPHDVKSQLTEKDPDAGQDWGQKGKQDSRERHGITDSINMNMSKLWEIVKDREAWCAAVHGTAKSQSWLSAEHTHNRMLTSETATDDNGSYSFAPKNA